MSKTKMIIDTENCWLPTYEDSISYKANLNISKINSIGFIKQTNVIFSDINDILSIPGYPLYNKKGEMLNIFKVSISDTMCYIYPRIRVYRAYNPNILEKYTAKQAIPFFNKDIVSFSFDNNDNITKIYNTNGSNFGYFQEITYNEKHQPCHMLEYDRMSNAPTEFDIDVKD